MRQVPDFERLLQVSYDWSKGAENHMPAQAQKFILLHPTQVYYFQIG
jgi:hypothetical protein